MMQMLALAGSLLASVDGPAELETQMRLRVLPAAHACYDEQLKVHPDLEGRILLRVSVGKDGMVTSVKVAEDHFGSAAVAACILPRVGDLHFSTVKDTTFEYPVVFVAKTRTLAVLPFQNLTGDAQMDWLRSALSETLLVKLGQVKTLVLVERARLKDILDEQALGQTGVLEESTAAKVAETMGAQLLVVGSYQKAGPQIRVVARVVGASEGDIKNSVEVTGKLDDLFAVQDQLAAKLAEKMDVGQDAEAQKAIAMRVSSNMATLELLGRAANAFTGAGCNPDYAQSAALYRQVIAQDPNLPEARLGLAHALFRLNRDDLKEAEEQLHKALELRPDYHEALSQLGFVLWQQDRHDEALAAQRKAVALKPDNALGYYGLGVAYASVDKGDDSLAMIKRAMELDPHNHEYLTQYGEVLSLFKNDPQGALEYTARAVAMQPTEWGWLKHAQTQLRAGKMAECLHSLDEADKLRRPHSRFETAVAITRAACLARSGKRAQAIRIIAALPSEWRQRLTAPLPEGMSALDRRTWSPLREQLQALRPR